MSVLHSLLCDAIADNNLGQVEALVGDMTSGQVNRRGPSGWTPLHFACDRNNKDAVALLLRVTNIQVNSLNSLGLSPLLVAANTGAKDTIKLLLDDDRIDLHAKDRDGRGLEDIVTSTFSGLPQDMEDTLSCIKKEREWRERLQRSRMKQEREQQMERVLRRSREEELAKINILTNQFEETVSLAPKQQETNRIIETVETSKAEERSLGGTNDDINGEESEDVESHLECPVCLEMMIPPTRIWQCAKNHLICQTCNNRMHDRFCPTCRTEKIIGRAHTVEGIARSIFPRRTSATTSHQTQTKEE